MFRPSAGSGVAIGGKRSGLRVGGRNSAPAPAAFPVAIQFLDEVGGRWGPARGGKTLLEAGRTMLDPRIEQCRADVVNRAIAYRYVALSAPQLCRAAGEESSVSKLGAPMR